VTFQAATHHGYGSLLIGRHEETLNSMLALIVRLEERVECLLILALGSIQVT